MDRSSLRPIRWAILTIVALAMAVVVMIRFRTGPLPQVVEYFIPCPRSPEWNAMESNAGP